MISERFDRIITIQSVTNTTDTYGATIQSWATYATIWAEKRDLSMRERLQAGQGNPLITVRYFAHYNSGITEKMRVVDGSDTFEILGVREIGRKEGLEIFAGTI